MVVWRLGGRARAPEENFGVRCLRCLFRYFTPPSPRKSDISAKFKIFVSEPTCRGPIEGPDRQTVLIGTRTHTPPDSISSRLRLCISHATRTYRDYISSSWMWKSTTPHPLGPGDSWRLPCSVGSLGVRMCITSLNLFFSQGECRERTPCAAAAKSRRA